MTGALVLTLLGIAAVDAVNPSALAVTTHLVARPDPWPAVRSYIAGIFTTYLSVGLVVLFAFRGAIDRVVDLASSSTARGVLQVVVGIVVVAFALRRSRRDRTGRRPPGGNLSSWGAFSMGVTVTMVESVTAVPYLGALAAVVRADVPWAWGILLLVLYNVVFLAPPIALALLAWRSGPSLVARAQAAIRAPLGRHPDLVKAMRVAGVLAGVALVATA